MNTISDNSILIEEAKLALREMRKCGFDAEESIETIDSYVNRIRTVCISGLVDYVIENKLTEFQKESLKDFWFNDITPDKTAERLNISVRSVYASRKKAQEILKEYLEPLIMYFRNMPSSDVMPAIINESRSVLRARKKDDCGLGEALMNIRLTFGAETALAAEALGIKEKELIKKEKSHSVPTVAELEAYSKVFDTKIILEFNNGNGEIKWLKH